MSKFAALKKKKTTGAQERLEESFTADTLSAALEPTEQAAPAKKARAKTNRTIPFSTRVSQAFDDDFRRIAFEGKMKHSELLEKALACYKNHEL